jgi:dynactin complex subunit
MESLGDALAESVKNASTNVEKLAVTGQETAHNLAEARSHVEAGNQEQLASAEAAESMLEKELAAATTDTEKPAELLVNHNATRVSEPLDPYFFTNADQTLANCQAGAKARWGVCPGMPA